MRGFIYTGLSWSETTGIVAIVTTLAVALFGVCGCAMLKHPYENRSSAIRVFVVVMIVVSLLSS